MKILDFLKQHFVLLDGGTGTLLQAAGLDAGERPESWNLSHPEEIVRLHAAYLEAGANVIAANTFGVNPLHYGPEELDRLIASALFHVRKAQAVFPDHPSFAALDLGPTGRLLEPMGNLPFEEAVDAFAQVVRAGVRHGADLIFIETMNDSRETRAALLAVKENSDLPVFVSNAYSENGRLLTGAAPAVMVAMLESMGADAIGVNCSMGPEGLAPIVREYLAHASVPVLMKANAGMPRVENGRTVYDVGPEEFARIELQLAAEGVRLLGGCCGTTPAHFRALAGGLAGKDPLPVSAKEETVVTSGSRAVFFGPRPLLIGERINPTGKKKLKQALLDGDTGYVLEQATLQEEQGADLLDVNVGLPGIDEPAVLSALVKEIQAITPLPLQIDTSDPKAMEQALRAYNGKALINSVNGKQEVMDAIFPLVKKYGGAVIALTLDENGIPDTADGRVAIAERIRKESAKYGIGQKDLIFDPLALTISAAPDAASVTLEAVDRIRHQLGCHTSLGVSNVSFGLPNREGINAVFLTLAMERGLSAAIMNPGAVLIMQNYRAFLALHHLDPNCGGWISAAARGDFVSAGLQQSPPPGVAAGAAPGSAVGSASAFPQEGASRSDSLNRAVIKGLKREAADLARDLLASKEPMAIIREQVIPALNAVGRDFEENRVFLPQLLMSAEAAGAAFEVIKSVARQNRGDEPSRGKIVLATVQGDIHDIGKNIVRLLLENYGFEVLDLGRDVPPETVLEAARKEQVRLVGLSALMTTTVPAMEQTIRLLHAELPETKICVGGAVLTQDYADRIGADHYAPDAMDTVRYAERIYPSTTST